MARGRVPAPLAAGRADRGRRRAGARARRDLRHRSAVAVPGRADPDVHGRLPAAAAARRCSATRSASPTSHSTSAPVASTRSPRRPRSAASTCWRGTRPDVARAEERRVAAERHVVRVELEREEQARAAVADERARIARELHDAVADSVSVMVLQAGGVRRLLGSDPGANASARRWPGSSRPAARPSASCTGCSGSCARASPTSRPRRRCGASTSSSSRSAAPVWTRR